VHGVFAQPSRVVGVGIATGDAEDTLRQQFLDRWSTLPRCRSSFKQAASASVS
jgi:hypothetical protein